MNNLLKITPKSSPYMSLTWQVNNFCNYQCSYCNPGNWAGSSRNNGSLDTYIKNVRNIFQQYQDRGYEHFKIFYSGGEPTYWENFIPLTEFLRDEIPNMTIAVNTNLSRPLRWWEQHHHLFDDIVASFHIEFVKPDRYIENAKFLCDKVNYLCTKMLMHEERFWEVVEFGNRVRNEVPNYNLEWTPLFDEMSVNAGPWKYNDPAKEEFLKNAEFETVQRISKPYRSNEAISLSHYSDGAVENINSNKIIAARQNFFKGWRCSVDDSLFINPIGNISSASCGVGNNHGNILDTELTFNLAPVICSKDHCHCGTDIIIPKERTDMSVIFFNN